MSVITYNWNQAPGVAGFPAWRYSGTCTFDAATLRTLETNGVHGDRVKFVPLPYRKELAVMATDGSTVALHAITPTGYDRQITDCVLIIPVQTRFLAPAQPVGHEYAGKTIVEFSVTYQQTKLNNVTD